MVSITGSFEEIVSAELDENGILCDDYVYITLTDKDYIDNAAARLRKLYPRLMNVSYGSIGQDMNISISDLEKVSDRKTPFEMFSDFFDNITNGRSMNDEQIDILNKAINEVWGEVK